MRNLKLLEKYQPPPPPPPAIKKKENLNLQENEKTSLLVKVSSTLKLPQALNYYEKASNPPLEKFSTLSRKIPTPCEKFSIPPENMSTPYPLKKFSTLLENVLTPPENFPCNHPENLFKATE